MAGAPDRAPSSRSRRPHRSIAATTTSPRPPVRAAPPATDRSPSSPTRAPVAAGIATRSRSCLTGCAPPAATSRCSSADSVDEALAACHDAVAGGVGALVAIGGDGTVNLALQAVAGTGVAFGAIPAGTGNDFVREIGLPARLVRPPPTRSPTALRSRSPAAPSTWPTWCRRTARQPLVRRGARCRLRRDRQRAGQPDAVPARPPPLRHRDRRRAAAAAAAARTRCALDGVDASIRGGAGRDRQHPELRRRHADLPGRRRDRRAARRRRSSAPISRTTFVRIKPRVYAGHPRRPSGGASATGPQTVEIAAEGIVAYVDGERTSPLPVTVTAMPARCRSSPERAGG